MKLDIKTVVLIVGWAITGAGLYFGMAAKLDRQTEIITELAQRMAVSEAQARAQERAIIELTVTLRTKGVIK